MDIISAPIRLDPAADGVMIEPSDWTPDDEAPCLMHHGPTHTIFEVQVDPSVDLDLAESLSPFDFFATLNHVCDGHAVPQEPTLTELGRAAIIAFIEFVQPATFRMTAYDNAADDLPF